MKVGWRKCKHFPYRNRCREALKWVLKFLSAMKLNLFSRAMQLLNLIKFPCSGHFTHFPRKKLFFYTQLLHKLLIATTVHNQHKVSQHYYIIKLNYNIQNSIISPFTPKITKLQQSLSARSKLKLCKQISTKLTPNCKFKKIFFVHKDRHSVLRRLQRVLSFWHCHDPLLTQKEWKKKNECEWTKKN